MTWGVVAATTVAVGSGIATSRAASKASDKAAEGAERSAAQVQAAADLARTDVLDFFPSAQQDLLAGAGAAGDLLSQGVTEQQRLLSAGNVGAQGTLGAGFGQVQNALLGVPVNQEAFAPREIALSQAPQNPLAQNLFSDVGQVKPDAMAARKETFLAESTNASVYNQIISGELSFPGVDPNWINNLVLQNNVRPADANRDLVDLAQSGTDEQIEAYMQRSGLDAGNQRQMRALIAGLRDIEDIL